MSAQEIHNAVTQMIGADMHVKRVLSLAPAVDGTMAAAKIDQGEGESPSASEDKAEITTLKRENKRLAQEKEFSKKPSAFFVKEIL